LRVSRTRPMHSVCAALSVSFEQLKKFCFFYSSGTGFDSLFADPFCLTEVIHSLLRSLQKKKIEFCMNPRRDRFL
jgi:hypothetical protein